MAVLIYLTALLGFMSEIHELMNIDYCDHVLLIAYEVYAWVHGFLSFKLKILSLVLYVAHDFTMAKSVRCVFHELCGILMKDESLNMVFLVYGTLILS